MPALVSLITLAATVLFFVTDQHWEMIAGAARLLYGDAGRLRASTRSGASSRSTDQSARHLPAGACAIASPFLIYTVIVNLAIGLVNKLTPQIPVYFISMPFVVAGGLALLYVSLGELLRVFMLGFQSWIDAL